MDEEAGCAVCPFVLFVVGGEDVKEGGGRGRGWLFDVAGVGVKREDEGWRWKA